MKKTVTSFLLLSLFLTILFGCSSRLLESPIQDFEYENYNDQEIKITKYIGNEVRVIIPSKIGTLPVTIIGESAFAGSNVESVVLSNNVVTVADGAFSGCKNLFEIQLGSQIKNIGRAAFAECSSLIEIDLSSKSMRNILDYAFLNCSNLKTVCFGDNITIIGEEAFHNCTSLEKVQLPKNLVEIGTYAFADCLGVQSIFVPKTLSKWGWSPFIGNTSCTEIVIEDGLKSIGSYGAFAGCQVKKLTIPSSVESIASIAFTEFNNLESVVFNGNAPQRGDDWPFGESKSSLTIYYYPNTSGWDITPLRNDYRVIPINNQSND